MPRGRPLGAKDRTPRKNAKAKVVEAKAEEAEALNLGQFAQSLLSDPAMRESWRKQLTDGTLSAQQMRAILQWAMQAPPETKRPSEWRKPLEVAEPAEVEMIANIFRRAMGKPERPIYLDGQTRAWTNLEIIQGIVLEQVPAVVGKVI